MRIVLVGPVYPYRGGIAHYTTRLAQELSGRHEVKVLSFSRQFPSWLYPGSSDKDPSQQVLSIEAEYLLEPLNPFSWWKSASWIKRIKPDLVLIQWWVTFWSPAYSVLAALCRQSRIPVAYMIHNVLPHEGGWIHRPLARLALGRGKGFIVHTPEECKRLLELLPGAPVQVCPFPVYDMLSVPAPLSQVEARKHLDIAPDAHIVLFFGIVRPYKGLKVLLEAMAALKKEDPKAILIVAGEFWEDKAAYLYQMEQLQLTGQIRLEDRYIPNEELGIFFAAADLAVAPYTHGTQSAVAALAQGFGIPLIATSWSSAGIGEEERSQVRIVPPGDSQALAEAIQGFFMDLENAPAVPRAAPHSGWPDLVEAIERFDALLGG